MKIKIFQDHEGNPSSFRVVWVISVLVIVLSWGWVSVTTKTLQPWPLDGISTAGIFVGSAIKTFSERKQSS